MSLDNSDLALRCPRDFSLAMASGFVKSFPAAQGGSNRPRLDLAFPSETSWQPVGVRIEQADHRLQGHIIHNAANVSQAHVQAEVERILNLRTARPGVLESIARSDPIAGALIHHFHGLRPVQFHTPYEAAAWAVISQRLRIGQAAAVRRRMAAEHGTRLQFPGGDALWAFPPPEKLLALSTFPGLTPRKLRYLHEVARAALDGRLNSSSLLLQPAGEALTILKSIPGIGPFSAELILVRGAGQADYLPHQEQRLYEAVRALYGIAAPGQLESLAEKWRPARSWVAFLMRTWWEAGCPRLERRPLSDGGLAGASC